MIVRSYKELIVWQKSMDLTIMVYKAVKQLPKEEIFSLSDQIRRAAISIPSNIAEGTGRFSCKEKLRFNEIAMGSLAELMCQLIIAQRAGYIDDETLSEFKSKSQRIGKMLSGYRRAMINKNIESEN